MLKKRGSEGGELSSGRTLLYAAEASQHLPIRSDSRAIIDVMLLGATTAILTNPIWVVKVRMFTTHPNDPTAYRGLWRAYLPLILFLRRSLAEARMCTLMLRTYPVYRWAIEYLQDGWGEGSLPRDSPGFGRRQQRRLTVRGLRTDKNVGV